MSAGDARGFTLTELLVAIAVSVVVAAAGYVFYTSTYTFSVTNNRSAQMQRELRIAMDLIGRDLRAAGLGLIDPLTGVVRGAVAPIQPDNNADPDPAGTANQLDHIHLVGGFLPVGRLSAPAARGATTITVALSPGIGTSDLNGQTFTLEGFYYGTATWTGSGTTFTVNPALDRDYTTLDSVLVIQTITYGIDTSGAEPVLYRQIGAGTREVLASGVEDLQFAYLMADGSVANAPAVAAPPALPDIRAVRVSLLARSLDPRPKVTAVSTRPALEDHAAAGAADRYHRRLVTKVVEVRNFGFLGGI